MLAEAYQKYLYVPRPVSKRYPMDVQHRAKQFAPFAALRGFEEIVRKQEILYEQRKMLSEEQKCGLDRKLQMVSVGIVCALPLNWIRQNTVFRILQVGAVEKK